MMSPNSLSSLQALCKLNADLFKAAQTNDKAFIEALSARKDLIKARGLTNEILVKGIPDELIVQVSIQKEGDKPEIVSIPAIEILAYHQETRTWTEVGESVNHQHEQEAFAEVFAFWYFKGRFGECASDYEINMIH